LITASVRFVTPLISDQFVFFFFFCWPPLPLPCIFSRSTAPSCVSLAGYVPHSLLPLRFCLFCGSPDFFPIGFYPLFSPPTPFLSALHPSFQEAGNRFDTRRFYFYSAPWEPAPTYVLVSFPDDVPLPITLSFHFFSRGWLSLVTTLTS